MCGCWQTAWNVYVGSVRRIIVSFKIRNFFVGIKAEGDLIILVVSRSKQERLVNRNATCYVLLCKQVLISYLLIRVP